MTSTFTPLSEINYLKSEERFILYMLSKMKDHLNRLKVEELNLRGIIRDKRLETIRKKDAKSRTNKAERKHRLNTSLDVRATLDCLSKGGVSGEDYYSYNDGIQMALGSIADEEEEDETIQIKHEAQLTSD